MRTKKNRQLLSVMNLFPLNLQIRYQLHKEGFDPSILVSCHSLFCSILQYTAAKTSAPGTDPEMLAFHPGLRECVLT